jgi:hypothetical protein
MIRFCDRITIYELGRISLPCAVDLLPDRIVCVGTRFRTTLGV